MARDQEVMKKGLNSQQETGRKQFFKEPEGVPSGTGKVCIDCTDAENTN